MTTKWIHNPYTWEIHYRDLSSDELLDAFNNVIVSWDITLSDEYKVLVDATATITLPEASISANKEYNIVRTWLWDVTIQPQSWQLISWDSNLVLTDQWDSVVITCDWSNWIRCS
jgi:hypothetical protein